MLKGEQIFRIGLIIFAFSQILTHTVVGFHELTAFMSGLGVSLSLVGTGKRFYDERIKT
ncbi:MAG: hypothetical protein FWF94_06575 [Oscillospiraceae bacterium]|nr:hypothetical protein [Oscillospiraceae bacterium]